MGYTTKPLGKLFTLDGLVQTISLWLKKETEKELDPQFLKKLINLATMDVAEIISGAGSDDYGRTAVISDQASSVSTSIVQSATYTDTSKNILKTTHGLTAADVGKRIAVWIGTTRITIAEIATIEDVDNFTITKALGTDGTVNYAVFSAHSTTNVDLSTYQLSNITKIVDSTNYEVKKVGDVEFDNLHRFDTNSDKVAYFKHGQTLFLWSGDDVTLGTLTMFYNGYPQETTEDDDYMDIRDMYIPLVIAKAKNYAMEHLGMITPDVMQQIIDRKTSEVRENIQREKEVINQKNVK